MTAPELKPCPFCGSPAEYGVTSDEGQRNDYDTIACTNCPATMRALLSWHDGEGEYRADLSAAWNRRADLYDAQAAEIADLRRQLSEARDRTTEQIVQQAAKDARDVFSDAQDAREAVDYMEQLIYAAIRALKGAAK